MLHGVVSVLTGGDADADVKAQHGAMDAAHAEAVQVMDSTYKPVTVSADSGLPTFAAPSSPTTGDLAPTQPPAPGDPRTPRSAPWFPQTRPGGGPTGGGPNGGGTDGSTGSQPRAGQIAPAGTSTAGSGGPGYGTGWGSGGYGEPAAAASSAGYTAPGFGSGAGYGAAFQAPGAGAGFGPGGLGGAGDAAGYGTGGFGGAGSGAHGGTAGLGGAGGSAGSRGFGGTGGYSSGGYGSGGSRSAGSGGRRVCGAAGPWVAVPARWLLARVGVQQAGRLARRVPARVRVRRERWLAVGCGRRHGRWPRREGEEDYEHNTPSYLITDEHGSKLVGTLPPVAPAVIGE